MSETKKELKTAVRTTSLEIWMPKGEETKATKARWLELSKSCQEFVNAIWAHWLVWHTQNKSRAKLISFLNEHAAWVENCKNLTAEHAAKQATSKKKLPHLKLPPKPECEVVSTPKELQTIFYEQVLKDFPNINIRTRSLLLQITKKKIFKCKAAYGNLRGWQAILLHKQQLPGTTHPNPVPFDIKNCVLVPPLKKDDDYQLRLRLDCFPVPGRKNSSSTLDSFRLVTRKRHCASQATILRNICAGKYEFCGSAIAFRHGKWFANISFQRPTMKQQADGDKIAILHAGRKRPWVLKIGKERLYFGGRGDHVSAVRRQVLTQRWSRQDNYRNAGSSTKGHGRQRALDPLYKLTTRWTVFNTKANHVTSREVINACAQRGVFRIYFMQPTEGVRETRFLQNAGKVIGKRGPYSLARAQREADDMIKNGLKKVALQQVGDLYEITWQKRDQTGWDWTSMVTQLNSKGYDLGIEVVVRKVGTPKQKNTKKKAS